LINLQLNSLRRAKEQEEKKHAISALCGLFIPGIPFTYGIKKGVNAAVDGLAAQWFADQTCEELKFFDFLQEFSGEFAQLGTDIALLRTKEDFQNFNADGLKKFMNADVFAMLREGDFYIDTSCLLGLVEVDTSPPLFKPKSLFNYNFLKARGHIYSFGQNGPLSHPRISFMKEKKRHDYLPKNSPIGEAKKL